MPNDEDRRQTCEDFVWYHGWIERSWDRKVVYDSQHDFLFRDQLAMLICDQNFALEVRVSTSSGYAWPVPRLQYLFGCFLEILRKLVGAVGVRFRRELWCPLRVYLLRSAFDISEKSCEPFWPKEGRRNVRMP